MSAVTQVNTLHVEFTSKCNLLCPQCARTDGDKVLSTLPLKDLDPALLDKALREFKELGFAVDEIHACGNYGDFSMCQNFFDHVKVIKSHNIKELRLYSNGAARDKGFWAQVAQEIAGFGNITFSIDGLADTSPIYRRGSKWDKVIENAQSFIAAGGHAIWEMLVFAHNEHQVTEAEKLAKELGFAQFRLKYPNRFGAASTVPLTPASVSPQNAPQAAPIQCKYLNTGWLYLSFEGDLFPCCWMAGRKYKKNQSANQIWQMFDSQGTDFLSLKHHSLQQILEGNFFKSQLPGSWKNSPFEICKAKCQGHQSLDQKYRQLY